MLSRLIIVGCVVGLAAAKPLSSSKSMLRARQGFPIPDSQGSVTFDAPEEISGTFDGGMKTYGRGVDCTGQDEGGDEDAVFILANGATLKNAIIGSDQIEGVHCSGSCTIENVWWEAVCEGMSPQRDDAINRLMSFRRPLIQGRRRWHSHRRWSHGR